MANAKNCEQAKSGECCYCKNMAYHKLEQTLLEIEQILDEALQKIKAARE